MLNLKKNLLIFSTKEKIILRSYNFTQIIFKITLLLIFILGVFNTSSLQACCFSCCEEDIHKNSDKSVKAPPRQTMEFSLVSTTEDKTLHMPQAGHPRSLPQEGKELHDLIISLDFNGSKAKGYMTPYKAPDPTALWKKRAKSFVGTGGRVHPIETRTAVLRPSEVPWGIVNGYISMKYKNGSTYRGSGTLVNKRHVLTAAHNLFDSELGWAEEVSFEIFIDNKREKIAATHFITTQEWIDKADENADIGMIILSENIGLRTGWNGILCGPASYLKNHTVNVTGHPSDLDPRGDTLYTAKGKIQEVARDTFTYDIDTAKGNSGSAVWGQWVGLDGYFCVGVHTNFLESAKLNQATRLSKRRFKEVVGWIQKY